MNNDPPSRSSYGQDETDHAGVSPTPLARLFQKKFNMTVVAYLRRRSVTEAIYLLTHSNMPIKQIALRCGVEDLSHFYKIIQKETHFTPLQIRKGDSLGTSYAISPYPAVQEILIKNQRPGSFY